MKNIVFGTLIAAALSTSAFADKGSLVGMQLGYSSNDVKATGVTNDKNGGVYLGFDIMGMMDSLPGFGIGLGLDMNIWSSQYAQNVTNNSGIYTFGTTAKVGYTFETRYNIPLKLKAGIGYGLMDIGVHDGWGLQYESSAEYTLYKGTGIGMKYKHTEAAMLDNEITNNSIIGFLSFGLSK